MLHYLSPLEAFIYIFCIFVGGTSLSRMFRQQKNPKGQENLSYIHTLVSILLVAVIFGGKVKGYIKQRKKVYEDKASLPATREFGSGPST